MNLPFIYKFKVYTYGIQSVGHTCHPVYGKQKRALLSYRYIDPYKRYVDDVYTQTTDESNADAFYDHMNNQHPNIKFEIEKPNSTPEGNCLSLLDITVHLTNEGNGGFKFYKKKANKPLFVHYKSALPKRSKVNIICNERKRINRRCSTEDRKINITMI